MIRHCLLVCFLLFASLTTLHAQTDFCGSFYNVANDMDGNFTKSKGELISADTTKDGDSVTTLVTSHWKSLSFFRNQSSSGEIMEVASLAGDKLTPISETATFTFTETNTQKDAEKIYEEIKKDFSYCVLTGWEAVQPHNSGSTLLGDYSLTKYANGKADKKVELLYTRDVNSKVGYRVKVVFSK